MSMNYYYHTLPLVLLLLACWSVQGKLFSATEQATGRWVVDIHYFPKRSNIISYLFGNRQQEEEAQVNNKSRKYKSLKCDLILRQDGSFLMKEKYNYNNRRKSTTRTRTSSADVDNHNCMNSTEEDLLATALDAPPMTIKGVWRVESNPYCITDCQYDTLVLHSYDIQRLKQEARKEALNELLLLDSSKNSSSSSSTQSHHKNDTTNYDDDDVSDLLNRLTKTQEEEETSNCCRDFSNIELRCRVRGRFEGQSIRSMMDIDHRRARFTHGVLSICNEQSSQRRRRRRIPMGAFRGQKTIVAKKNNKK